MSAGLGRLFIPDPRDHEHLIPRRHKRRRLLLIPNCSPATTIVNLTQKQKHQQHLRHKKHLQRGNQTNLLKLLPV